MALATTFELETLLPLQVLAFSDDEPEDEEEDDGGDDNGDDFGDDEDDENLDGFEIEGDDDDAGSDEE